MTCHKEYNSVTNPQQQPTPILDNQINDLFLTVRELAEKIRVCEHTLRDWIYKKQIPVCRIRGRVRFRWSEIEKWLQEGSHVS